MKKIRFIFALIVLLLISFQIFAYEVTLMPRAGGFGLNMATDFYDFNDYENDITYNINYTTSNNTSKKDQGLYFEDAIISLGQVLNIDASQSTPDPSQPIIVSASCPGGFYFSSLSNPDAKRPFEIKVVFKRSVSDEDGQASTGTIWSDVLTLGEDSEQEISNQRFPEENAYWPKYSKDWYWPYHEYNRYRYIWCDLVICLPFDSVTSTGVLTANGRTYNLIEADDYSAVVTLTITYNGENHVLTIPMSGYYSRNASGDRNFTSLSVRSLPRAMNLNIGGTRRYERVALIDFMAYQTRYEVNKHEPEHFWEDTWYSLDLNPENLSNFSIFLSASNDASNPEDRGFELVHSSVKYTDPHTPYNSIGYTARLVSEDSETGAVLGYMDFDGTDAIEGNHIPGIRIQYKGPDNNTADVYYSEFHGGVEVLIDEISATGDQEGINKMLSGQYTSTIYVHVVGE